MASDFEFDDDEPGQPFRRARDRAHIPDLTDAAPHVFVSRPRESYMNRERHIPPSSSNVANERANIEYLAADRGRKDRDEEFLRRVTDRGGDDHHDRGRSEFIADERFDGTHRHVHRDAPPPSRDDPDINYDGLYYRFNGPRDRGFRRRTFIVDSHGVNREIRTSSSRFELSENLWDRAIPAYYQTGEGVGDVESLLPVDSDDEGPRRLSSLPQGGACPHQRRRKKPKPTPKKSDSPGDDPEKCECGEDKIPKAIK